MTLAKLYIHSLRNSVSVSSPQSLSAIRHLTREKKRLVLLSVLPRSQSQKTGKAHALPRGPGEREGTQTTHLASLGDSGTTQVDPIRPIVLMVLIVLAPLAFLRRWGDPLLHLLRPLQVCGCKSCIFSCLIIKNFPPSRSFWGGLGV